MVQALVRSETESWWRQAQADLALARQAPILAHAYAVTWFSQQCVEKGLKALYLEQHNAMPPRTHDLEYLGRRVQAPETVASHPRVLNPAFDLSRYPDPETGNVPVDNVSDALAAQHLGAAEVVMEWIDTCLNPQPPQS
jgi:HEPN domain-containing protein